MNWWSKNSKPSMKSSNPGFEVSICCFYNLGKAKWKTSEEKLHIRKSFVWTDLIHEIQFLHSTSQCHIHLQRQGLQPEQREGLGILLYGGFFPVFQGDPKSQAGRGETPTILSLLEAASLFHGLLERFQERPTSKLEDWWVKVLEICLLPEICFHSYFKNWN